MIGIKKPFTHIYKPLVNAVTARATTNIRNMKDTNIINNSVASKSKKSYRRKVMNLVPLTRNLVNQYSIIEKRKVIMNKNGSLIIKLDTIKSNGPIMPFARSLKKVAWFSK